MQRRKEVAKKKEEEDIFISLSAFSLWRATALLSVKVADVSSFFSSDFYKTYGTARLLFNFMFSLQEARLLLPRLRGVETQMRESAQTVSFQINLLGAGERARHVKIVFK